LYNFVLKKEADKRPPAKELLKHRFIKNAKKTSYLTELIERYEKWVAEGHGSESSSDESDKSDNEDQSAPWDFATVNAKNNNNVKNVAQAIKEEQNGEAMILTSVVSPILTKLAGNASGGAKSAIESLKKDFDAAEKSSPGFTHNFVSEILDLMKKK